MNSHISHGTLSGLHGTDLKVAPIGYFWFSYQINKSNGWQFFFRLRAKWKVM